jgi:hypothetical protein
MEHDAGQDGTMAVAGAGAPGLAAGEREAGTFTTKAAATAPAATTTTTTITTASDGAYVASPPNGGVATARCGADQIVAQSGRGGGTGGRATAMRCPAYDNHV